MANSKKLNNFLSKLDQVDPAYGKDIGIIVCKRDNDIGKVASDISEDEGTVLRVNDDQTTDELVHAMTQKLEEGGSVYLHIGNHLPPKLYNQLKLIAESARVQYFQPEGDITADLPDDARLVLVTSQSDLEELNYSNIFMLGPVLNV